MKTPWPLRITLGECAICGNGYIEFSGKNDSQEQYTHDEYTPFEERSHTVAV